MPSRFNEIANWLEFDATEDELEVLAKALPKLLNKKFGSTDNSFYIKLNQEEWNQILFALDSLELTLNLFKEDPKMPHDPDFVQKATETHELLKELRKRREAIL